MRWWPEPKYRSVTCNESASVFRIKLRIGAGREEMEGKRGTGRGTGRDGDGEGGGEGETEEMVEQTENRGT
eukprot:4953102-Pleurochrysis_carterae.AAC.1